MAKNIQSIPIQKIVRDGRTQARVETSEETAGEYALALQGGAALPPPVLFHDGQRYWIGDGHHTIRAHEIAKLRQVTAEIRKGDDRNAILYACGANVAHGLRRTNADKRKAVKVMLDDAEWGKWPNTKIAIACLTAESFVRKIRQEQRQAVSEKNSHCAIPKETFTVDDLPPDRLAAFRAMPMEEQKSLVAAVQADTEQERADRVAAMWQKIGYHLGQLRNFHAELLDVADEANALLDHYRKVVWASKTWA